MPDFMEFLARHYPIQDSGSNPIMGLTTDPNDPRLTHGPDDHPVPQADTYLVLTEEERAKGFVRPVRRTYLHIGPPGPKYKLQDLTADQREMFEEYNYVKYEPYPESEAPALGKFWTQASLDRVGNGCNTTTTMSTALAETYARQPSFYGSTYCVYCQMHRPVEEFVWDGTSELVGS